MLALAHVRRALTCELCGLPTEQCRAAAMDGNVSVDVERCHVTAALLRKRRANEQDGFDLPESLSYAARIATPVTADPPA
jgi:hypothetical protein